MTQTFIIPTGLKASMKLTMYSSSCRLVRSHRADGSSFAHCGEAETKDLVTAGRSAQDNELKRCMLYSLQLLKPGGVILISPAGRNPT